MNRNFKVVWNRSLGCFTAVAEYAKSRGKSSSGTVSSGASPSTGAMAEGARLVKLSALCVGMAATGFSMQAVAGYEVGGGSTFANCTRDATGFGTEASSIAIGNGGVGNVACASGAETIAIGANLEAAGSQSTVIGNDIIADSNAAQAVIIGSNFNSNPTTSTGAGGVAIGSGLTPNLDSPIANGIGSVAIGSSGNATTNGLNGAIASGNHALALMSGAEASAANSVAIGAGSRASSANAYALGENANAAAQNTVALGADTSSNTQYGVSIGRAASSTGQSSVAIGGGTAGGGAAQTSGQGAIAIGSGGNNAGGARATNTRAIAIGQSSEATGTSSISIGATANANIANSVALGAGSTTTTPAGNSFLTNVAVVPANGVVSVGTAAATRRIQNVAGGSAATDAVNVAQLTEQNTRTNRQGTDTAAALGGGSTYTANNGAVSLPTYNVDGATFNNVGAALGNIDGRTTTNTGNITSLQNQTFRLRANTDTSTAVAAGDTVTFIDGNNVEITRAGNNVTIGTSATPTFTTVTSTGAMNAGSLTVTGASNLNGGANLNNNKITGVAAGTVATDAVNFGQLTTTNNNVTNAQNAANAAQTAADLGFNITANGVEADEDNVQLGETVDFTSDANLVTTVSDNGINYSLADAITVDSVTANDGNGNITTVSATGTNVTDGPNTSTYGADGFTTTDGTTSTVFNQAGVTFLDDNNAPVGPSLTATGIDAGNTVITSVADGSLADDSTDAINGAQLNTAASSIATNLGGNSTFDPTTGIVTAPSYVLDDGTNTGTNAAPFTNVGDALGNLDTRTSTNTGDIANVQAQSNLGFNITANGVEADEDNVQLGETVDFTSDANLVTTVSDNGINYSLADAITVDSVTANDGNGNITTVSATGTNVTDGPNTSTYGADGFTTTDGTTSTVFNQAGVTFLDDNNAPVGPSLTATGIDAGNTVITSVADGSLADDSTDAINGAQLNTAASSIATNLGGNSTFDPTTGIVTAPSYVLDDGTNTGTNAAPFTNVGDALGNLDTRTSTNTGDIANVQAQSNLGFNITANGVEADEDNVQLGETVDFTSDANLVTTVSDNGINYSLADAITVDSVTANDGNGNITTVSATGTNVTDGPNTSTYGADGFTTTDGTTSTVFNQAGVTFLDDNNAPVGPSLTATGVDAGNTVITSVADGSLADDSTDAINGAQLNTAASSIATNLGGNSTFDPTTGIVTAPSYVLDDGTNTGTNAAPFTNVGDALGNLDTRTSTNTGDIANVQAQSNLGFNITANGVEADEDNVQLGETVDFTSDANLVTTVSDNGINYSLADAITVDSVTANDGNGNITTVSATGTNVTDGPNTSTYGADGFTTTDGTTSTVFNQAGVTFLDDNNAPVGPSLTATGIDAGNTVITSVADGSLADDSTDAINGAQLNTAASSIATNLGGNSTFDPTTGIVTAPSYVLDDGTNTGTNAAPFTNVGDALGNLDTRTSTNTGDIANVQAQSNLGFNITANGVEADEDNVQLGETVDFTSDANLVTTVSDNGINYSLADAITVDSVTANDGNGNITTVSATGTNVTDGPNTSTYGADGFTTTDGTTSTVFNQAGVTFLDDNNAPVGPSLTATGVDAGNTVITSVADGSLADDSTDAINGAQLNTAASSIATNLGGNSTFDPTTGIVTAPSYVLDDGTNTGTNAAPFTNVGDALGNLDTRTSTNTGDIANVQAQSNLGFNITANGVEADEDNVQLGETVDFTSDANLVTTVSDNGINYSLADAITVDSVTANDGNGNITTVSATGTNVTDGPNTSTYGADGFTTTDGTTSTVFNQAGVTFLDDNNAPVGPSLTATGIDAGNTVITSVADGSLADDSTDAINGAQLNTAASSIATNLGGNSTFDPTTGIVTAPSYVLDDGTNTGTNAAPFTNVGDALGNLDTRTSTNTGDIANVQAQSNLGFNITANGVEADEDNVQLGETVDFTSDANLVTTVSDNGINYSLADAITVDSVTANDGNGNITTVSATGTNVTDGPNTSTYGADGFTTTDGTTSTVFNQAGVTFLDDNNAPVGPSLTATGVDAGNTVITSVADGSLADDSTDAINGAQLNTAASSIATNLGGNSTFDPTTGIVTAPSYVLDDGTNTGTNAAPFTNVGDALGNLDTRTSTNTGDIANVQAQSNLGFNITANGVEADEDNVQLGETVDFTSDANLVTTVSDNGINYSLADAITVDSVTANDGNGNITTVSATGTNVTDGPNTSTYGADGFTTTDGTTSTVFNQAGVTFLDDNNAPVGPSLTATGIDAGNTVITSVADGSLADDSTDAINGAQLNTAASSIATNLGGNSTFDPTTGIVTAPSYVLDDGTNTGTNAAPFTNVGDALGNLDTRTSTNTGDIANVQAQSNLGFNITANGVEADEDNVQLGETVDFTSDANLVTTVSDNGINYSLADAITVDSVTANDGNGNITTVSATGTNVTDGPNTSTYGADGFTTTDGTTSTVFNQAGVTFLDDNNAPVGPSLTATGVDAGNTVITSVADGSLADDSTDAINGAQLNTAASSIATNLGGNSTFDPTTGIVTAPSYVLDDGTNTGTNAAPFTNVGDALGNLDTRTSTNTGDIANVQAQSNLGFNITANGVEADEDNVQLGETVDFTSDANLVTTVSDNGINYSLADAITVDSVTANDGNGNITTVSATGTNVTDGPNTSTYGADGFTTTDGTTSTVFNQAGVTFLDDNNAPVGPSLTATGIDAGNTVITSVADGSLADDSTDAINGAQLNTAASSIATNLGGNSTFDPTTGIVTAPSYVLDDGTNTGTNAAPFTNVGDALGNLDTRTSTNTGDINDLAAGRTGIVRQDAGTGVITVGAQTGGNSVSFAGTDGNRQLTGVANGTVAAGSTEAVTGDQLNTSAASLATIIGGNAVNNGGVVTTTDIGGTGADTIDGAISSLNTAATQAKSTVTQGENILVATTTNADGSTNYEVATARDLDIDSVVTGNSTLNSAGLVVNDGTNASTYGADGLTISGGPSITTAGIDAGGNALSNLADGVATTDAATVGQLNTVSGDLTDLSAGSVQYDRNPDNTVNYDSVSLAGTQAVIDTDDDGNDFVVSGGTTLGNVANGINADDAVNKGQLDSVIAQNLTDVNVTDQDGNEVTVNITDQVVNRNLDDDNEESLFLTYDVEGQEVTDRLTIGETVQKMNTQGVKFSHTNAVSTEGDLGVTNDSSAGGANSTAIGVNAIVESGADNTVALGFNTKATSEATNAVVVGNGSVVSGASSIAIGNGAQANGNQSISVGTGNVVNGNNSGAFGDPSVIDGNNSYSVGNNNTVNSNDAFVLGNNVTETVEGSVVLGTGSGATTGAGIAGYGAVNDAAIAATTSTTGAVAVGNANNEVYRQVTGVAAGTADSDAVNVSQLRAVDNRLVNNMNDLGYKINDVEDGANAGISAAMAMSSLPQAYIPGKAMVGGGIATYNGQSAVAIGLSKVSDNGRWVIKANGTADSEGNAGGAVGAGFHF